MTTRSWFDDHPTWRGGRWSLEVRGDEIADIRVGGHLILRGVRIVVRDRNWDTAALRVDGITSTDATLTLAVHSEGLGSSLHGHLRVDAGEGRLRITADLVPTEPFETNRTGLVILHPPSLAGTALRVTHPGGEVEASHIPAAISPHQPVRDIVALEWDDTAAGAVRLDFAGDVFEMEDQRNWTDASFKTYSRPLSLPFPYRLAAGERVVQTLEISCDPAQDAAPAAPADHLDLVAVGVFPDIALGASTAPDPAPAFDTISAAVLVELDLATANWRAALERAAAAGAPVDVRFVLSDDDPDALADGVAALRGHDVARVTAFLPTGPARHVSDRSAIAALRAALANAASEAPARTPAVVGGARSHFTELSREHHRLPEDLDGVVFSTTPLFHSLDTEQIIESLAMQRLVAEQAVGLAAGIPVHIGPIGLRPHFNDVATTPPPRPAHADLREGYGAALLDLADPRQDAEELAAWTVASAAALAVTGVATLSFFEQWGPRGILRSDGTERPVAAAVRALAALRGTRLLSAPSPDGLVWALGGVAADRTETVLLANVDRHARFVQVRTPGGETGIHLGPSSWTRLPQSH